MKHDCKTDTSFSSLSIQIKYKKTKSQCHWNELLKMKRSKLWTKWQTDVQTYNSQKLLFSSFQTVFVNSPYCVWITKDVNFKMINESKNVPSSVRRSCFAAPGPGAWKRRFPGHRGLGPGRLETWASSAEDGSWSYPSAHTQRQETPHVIHLSLLQNEFMMLTWLWDWPSPGSPWPGSWVCPPASGWSGSGHRSSCSSACSCPAAACTASPTLGLASAGGHRDMLSGADMREVKSKTKVKRQTDDGLFYVNDFDHTCSFLSSTSSELRSSSLRIVELRSATRLWFLLMSWNKPDNNCHLTDSIINQVRKREDKSSY